MIKNFPMCFLQLETSNVVLHYALCDLTLLLMKGCSSLLHFPPPLLLPRQDYASAAILLHFMDCSAANEANSSMNENNLFGVHNTLHSPCSQTSASSKGSQVCVTKVSGRQEDALSGMSVLDLFKNNEQSLKNLIFSLTLCPEILHGLTSAVT